MNEKKKEKVGCPYFLSLSPNFTARPHESKVNPIGNTPLVNMDGISLNEIPLLLYTARAIGKTANPTTPTLFWVVDVPSCFVSMCCAVMLFLTSRGQPDI